MANKRIRHERKLIIILAALSLLFFALTFGIRAAEGSKVSDEQAYIDEATMADLPNRMEITSGGEDFVLESEKGSWYLEGYRDVPIDGLQVTDTRSVSKYFAPGRVLAGQEENLGKFGLRDPEAVVTLKTDSSEITYLVGDFNPITNEYYVSLKGSDTVFMIPAKDGNSLRKTVTDYVDDPEISDASFSDVYVMMVMSPDSAYIIVSENGTYLLRNSESTYEIDKSKAMEIFNCFTSSVNYSCVSYDTSEDGLRSFGLDDPEVQVRFRMASDDRELGLRVSTGPDGIHYITDDEGKIVYTMSDDDYSALINKIKIRIS